MKKAKGVRTRDTMKDKIDGQGQKVKDKGQGEGEGIRDKGKGEGQIEGQG